MKDELIERKQFRILGGKGATIDWQLVADHGKQAYENHRQSVQRLDERGGLAWRELHAVLHNRPYQKMDENTAMIECRALEARYLTAQQGEADNARIASLVDDIAFIAKWIERAIFDPDITADEALSVISGYPGMPWHNERWDVDHKPYAEKFYKRFPKARALTQEATNADR